MLVRALIFFLVQLLGAAIGFWLGGIWAAVWVGAGVVWCWFLVDLL